MNRSRWAQYGATNLLRQAIVLLLMLAGFGCQQFTSQMPGASPPTGAELFQEKCGTCHEADRATKEYRSADDWRTLIARMLGKPGSQTSQQDLVRLVDYHKQRQQREITLFDEKCQRCHPGDRFVEQKLTDSEIRALIKRMQEKAGNAIIEEDVDIIIRYHAQAQQAALKKNLQGILKENLERLPTEDRGQTLFADKCSSCHDPARALAVLKDPKVWQQTITRMQDYSKGTISGPEARSLVSYHVSRQQREIDAFQDTCTRCHDDARINSRSMTEEQWLVTIKRMQQKAPELITDQKLELISAYFHRREMTLARLFYGKCQLCHVLDAAQRFTTTPVDQMDRLIATASNEFGRSLQIRDVRNLSSIHRQKQRRNLQLYESNCRSCHAEGLRQTQGKMQISGSLSREDWIPFLALKQGMELNQEARNTINSQIDFHISEQ